MVFKIFPNSNLGPTNLNGSMNKISTLQCLDIARQLLDRSVTFNKAYVDGFGEAYTDSDGRLNSVDTANTTAVFMTDKYKYIPYLATGTTENSGAGNSYDADTSTYSFNVVTSAPGIFSTIYAYAGNSGTLNIDVKNSTGTITYATKTTAGGGAGPRTTTFTSADYTDGYLPAGTYQITIRSGSAANTGRDNSNPAYSGSYMTIAAGQFYIPAGSGGGVIFTLYTTNTNCVVKHTIPAGTFKSTISKIFLAPHLAYYEDGIDVQVKLTNGSEDSGYMSIFDSDGNLKWNSFTAFTSEPTALYIKLIPKGSSPTAGYPAIYAYGCMGDIA